jgi:hypothetical protein
METYRHIWASWEQWLHRWGVQDLTTSFLEAIGPMTILGAQGIYLVQPWLYRLLPDGHLEALVEILENPDETRAFVRYLREGTAT